MSTAQLEGRLRQPGAVRVQQGGAFVGTPEDVVGQVQACIDAFGAIEPSMQINFGGSRDEEAFRTLELFASAVMPAFRKVN